MKKTSVAVISVLSILCIGVQGDKCYQNGMTITCQTEFQNQDVSLTMELETCRKKPKVTMRFEVSALGIDYEKSFENSQEIPIPGFSIAGNGVFLGVDIYSRSDGYTNLKIKLSLETVFGKLTSVTLLDEPIAQSNCNAFLYWWNSQNDGIKAGVGGGASLILIILIACCCKCCCCKKKTSSGTTFVMVPPIAGSPPGGDIIVQNSTQQVVLDNPPPHSDQFGYQKFQ